MNKRSRWTFALLVGAAAVTCFVLFGILDGAIQYAFLALGIVFAGSTALPPTLGKHRAREPEPLSPGEFSVVLVEPGDRPLLVIKTLRAVAHLDLESARRCVQTTPSTVVQQVSSDGAAKVSEALTGSGAQVRVQKS